MLVSLDLGLGLELHSDIYTSGLEQPDRTSFWLGKLFL